MGVVNTRNELLLNPYPVPDNISKTPLESNKSRVFNNGKVTRLFFWLSLNTCRSGLVNDSTPQRSEVTVRR